MNNARARDPRTPDPPLWRWDSSAPVYIVICTVWQMHFKKSCHLTPPPPHFSSYPAPARHAHRNTPRQWYLDIRSTRGIIFSPRFAVSVWGWWFFLSFPSPLFMLRTPPMPFKDITKQREASRRHYAKHRAKVIAKAKQNSKIAKDRVRAYIKAHLEANPCVDCGETDIVVLEFDHVGEAGTKHFSISDATRLGYGMPKIQAEIAKCEVRCANCHRKKTYERGGWTHRG